MTGIISVIKSILRGIIKLIRTLDKYEVKQITCYQAVQPYLHEIETSFYDEQDDITKIKL